MEEDNTPGVDDLEADHPLPADFEPPHPFTRRPNLETRQLVRDQTDHSTNNNVVQALHVASPSLQIFDVQHRQNAIIVV